MNVGDYKIPSPFYFIIRDAADDHEQLLFHVYKGDYFAVLATTLGFIEETLAKMVVGDTPSPELSALRNMRKDLLFLHAEYDIREKEGCALSET